MSRTMWQDRDTSAAACELRAFARAHQVVDGPRPPPTIPERHTRLAPKSPPSPILSSETLGRRLWGAQRRSSRMHSLSATITPACLNVSAVLLVGTALAADGPRQRVLEWGHDARRHLLGRQTCVLSQDAEPKFVQLRSRYSSRALPSWDRGAAEPQWQLFTRFGAQGNAINLSWLPHNALCCRRWADRDPATPHRPRLPSRSNPRAALARDRVPRPYRSGPPGSAPRRHHQLR